MPVQHFQLDAATLPYVHSTYQETLKTGGESVLDHPGSYTVCADTPLAFRIFHGRLDPAEDMNDWGFDGPIFSCLTVAHDPDRILLQGADALSLELAKRLGLETHDDTVSLYYQSALVVIPRFRDAGPAYFGDHSAYLQT